MTRWYKKAFDRQYWTNDIRYGWFTIGISWDNPRAIDDFSKSENIRDMVEDNCILTSNKLERIGFPKQHAYVIFEGEEDFGLATPHTIKLPVKLMYRENWDYVLTHEWAHMYHDNLSKETKQAFVDEYNRVTRGAVEQEEDEVLAEMIERVVPESIKKKFPVEKDIWKIYVGKMINKPEMEAIRTFLKNKKYTPTSYAATSPDELWADGVANYDKLEPNMKNAISKAIERG